MERLAGALALLAIAGCALTSPPALPVPDDHAAEGAEVVALERAFWTAEQHKDWATLDRLLAPDYRYLSARDGADRSKADEMALLSGGRVAAESATFGNMRATWIAPDVIALNYMVDQRFVLDGVVRCPQSGSMTLWVRREGAWLRRARTEYAITRREGADCAAATATAPGGTTSTWRESRHVPGLAFRFEAGDPSKAGPFRYLLKVAPGTAVGVHRHTAAMHIRVVQGRKFVLMGDPPERQPVRVVEEGETLTIPAGVWHVEWWEAATVEEISGTGPLHTERPPEAVPSRGAARP